MVRLPKKLLTVCTKKNDQCVVFWLTQERDESSDASAGFKPPRYPGFVDGISSGKALFSKLVNARRKALRPCVSFRTCFQKVPHWCYLRGPLFRRPGLYLRPMRRSSPSEGIGQKVWHASAWEASESEGSRQKVDTDGKRPSVFSSYLIAIMDKIAHNYRHCDLEWRVFTSNREHPSISAHLAIDDNGGGLGLKRWQMAYS